MSCSLIIPITFVTPLDLFITGKTEIELCFLSIIFKASIANSFEEIVTGLVVIICRALSLDHELLSKVFKALLRHHQ